MKFSVLLVIALAAQGCGSGDSPVAPTSSGCSSGWTGGGGSTVSGLTLSAQGAASPYVLSLKDVKVGETTEFSVVLDPPRVVSWCGTSRAYDKFAYLKWTWNSVSSGPPSYGPIAVKIASCQCSLFGEPAWKDKSSTVASAHWEQRAWLAASQTVTFSVTGTEVGSTRVDVSAYIDQPRGGLVDGVQAAFGSVQIRVVR